MAAKAPCRGLDLTHILQLMLHSTTVTTIATAQVETDPSPRMAAKAVAEPRTSTRLICRVKESPFCTLESLIAAEASTMLPAESTRHPLPTPRAICARSFNASTSSSKPAFTVAVLPLSSLTSTDIDMLRTEDGTTNFENPLHFGRYPSSTFDLFNIPAMIHSQGSRRATYRAQSATSSCYATYLIQMISEILFVLDRTTV